jgi:hypothetical protein
MGPVAPVRFFGGVAIESRSYSQRSAKCRAPATDDMAQTAAVGDQLRTLSDAFFKILPPAQYLSRGRRAIAVGNGLDIHGIESAIRRVLAMNRREACESSQRRFIIRA